MPFANQGKISMDCSVLSQNLVTNGWNFMKILNIYDQSVVMHIKLHTVSSGYHQLEMNIVFDNKPFVCLMNSFLSDNLVSNESTMKLIPGVMMYLVS